MFSTFTGGTIDSARDWKDWKQLLADAGVRDARLHDARHSAATFRLIAGVELRTVMPDPRLDAAVHGARYQHVVDELKVDAANRTGLLLWGEAGPQAGKPAPALGRSGRARRRVGCDLGQGRA